MGLDAALTGGEITNLAGASTFKAWLSFERTSAPVATAQVASSPAFPATTIAVNNTSAGWNNVGAGMIALIGTTAGAFDIGIYRVRKIGTSSTLELAAMSSGDPGLVPIAMRPNPILAGHYITILFNAGIFGRFPRIDNTATPATIYEDYDTAYGSQNQTPDGQVNITINSQPSNYATWVDTGQTYATITFTCSLVSFNGATASTFLWTITNGTITVTGGSTSSSTFTAQVPAQGVDYTISCFITDSNSIQSQAYRSVWVHSATFPPMTIDAIPQDEADRTGAKMTVALYGQKAAQIYPGALVHVWYQQTWSNGAVASAVTCFTGFVLRQTERSLPGIKSVELELVGPAGILATIGQQSQIFQVVTTPYNWQTITNTLSYVDFIMWWILRNRAAGVVQRFNYTPLGISNTTYAQPTWRIDTGTLLAQCQALATRVGANFGFDWNGEAFFQQHPALKPYATRYHTTVTRGTWGASNTVSALAVQTLEPIREMRGKVRRLRGEGFWWDGSSTLPTAVLCDAPGFWPGQGQGEQKYEKQVTQTDVELFQRTGDEYARRNNPYPNIPAKIPKNFHVVKPAQMQFWVDNFNAFYRPDNANFTPNVIPLKVTRTHNPDGTVDTKVDAEAETTGLPATVFVVTQSSMFTGGITPISPNPIVHPPPPIIGHSPIPQDGNAVIVWSASNLWLCLNFLAATPTFVNITPTSGFGGITIKSVQIDPQATTLGQCWLLGSDGTNSWIWYSPDVLASARTWTKGAQLTGVYTDVRQSNNAIQCYAPNLSGSNSAAVYDFTSNNQGFTVSSTSPPAPYYAAGNLMGVYGGSGWTSTVFPPSGNSSGLGIQNNVSGTLSATLSGGNVAIMTLSSSAAGSSWNIFFWALSGGTWYNAGGAHNIPGTATDFGFAMPTGLAAPITAVGVDLYELSGGSDTITISKLQIGFTVANGANVATSFGNGNSWAAVQNVGTAVSATGGFDALRLFTSNMAASALQANYTLTSGGAYTADATGGVTAHDPLCIELPWYRWGSTLVTNLPARPDYAMATADGLFKVVAGSAAVNITPAVGAVAIASNGAITTWKGTQIACIMVVSGTRHLYTSTNSGSTWTDRGALNANANWVRVKRVTGTGQIFYVANYANIQFTNSFGGSLTTVTGPASNLIGVEAWG